MTENEIKQKICTDLMNKFSMHIMENAMQMSDLNLEKWRERATFRKIEEDMMGDIEDKIKKQIREENEHDIKRKLKEELEDSIRAELREDLRQEIYDEIHDEVEEDVRYDLRKELREEVRAELMEELEDEVKKEIATEFELIIKNQMLMQLQELVEQSCGLKKMCIDLDIEKIPQLVDDQESPIVFPEKAKKKKVTIV